MIFFEYTRKPPCKWMYVFQKYCVCLTIRNNNITTIAYLPHTARTCIRVVTRLPPYVYVQSKNIIHNTHTYISVCVYVRVWVCVFVYVVYMYMYMGEGVTEGPVAGVLYKYAGIRSKKNTI